MPPPYLAFSRRPQGGLRIGVSDLTSFLSVAMSSGIYVGLVAAMTTCATFPFVLVLVPAFPGLLRLAPLLPWVAIANLAFAFRLVMPMILLRWSREFARVVARVWEEIDVDAGSRSSASASAGTPSRPYEA